MGCSGSTPPLRQRDTRYPAGGKQHKSWGSGSCRLTFWGENTCSQGGVLPWPQPHSQALARRHAISTAGQPASPMHGKTPGSCLHRAGPQARTVPSLPSCNTPAAGRRAVCGSYFCWSWCHAAPTPGPAPRRRTGCAGPAAGGQMGHAKIHLSAHEVNFYRWGGKGGKKTPLCGIYPEARPGTAVLSL